MTLPVNNRPGWVPVPQGPLQKRPLVAVPNTQAQPTAGLSPAGGEDVLGTQERLRRGGKEMRMSFHIAAALKGAETDPPHTAPSTRAHLPPVPSETSLLLTAS